MEFNAEVSQWPQTFERVRDGIQSWHVSLALPPSLEESLVFPMTCPYQLLVDMARLSNLPSWPHLWAVGWFQEIPCGGAADPAWLDNLKSAIVPNHIVHGTKEGWSEQKNVDANVELRKKWKLGNKECHAINIRRSGLLCFSTRGTISGLLQWTAGDATKHLDSTAGHSPWGTNRRHVTAWRCGWPGRIDSSGNNSVMSQEAQVTFLMKAPR